VSDLAISTRVNHRDPLEPQTAALTAGRAQASTCMAAASGTHACETATHSQQQKDGSNSETGLHLPLLWIAPCIAPGLGKFRHLDCAAARSRCHNAMSIGAAGTACLNRPGCSIPWCRMHGALGMCETSLPRIGVACDEGVDEDAHRLHGSAFFSL
jgi:hypothetical protein